jgi:hypothetical protein
MGRANGCSVILGTIRKGHLVTTTKILPNRGDDERGFISNIQESSILRQCWEFSDDNPNASHGVLNASTMDSGKTLMSVEVIVRMGFKRVLILGVRDTFHQWADRLAVQSDGALELRRMDSSIAGRAAWADAMAGAPGIFFAGAEWITAQDWETRLATDHAKNPVWKLDKEAKEPILDEMGQPIQDTVQYHLNIFKRARITHNPFELLIFDEVQKVANRKSVGRKTLVTIPTINKLALSGTPVGNKFENAWGLVRWIWDGIITVNFKDWSDRWCESKEVRLANGRPLLNAQGKPTRKLGSEKVEGEFVKTLPCYIRIEAERDVPEPEIVEVDLTVAQRNDYDDLMQDLVLYLQSPEGERATLVADIPVVLRTHLRSATLGVMSMTEERGIFYADNTQSSKLHALRGILDREDWAGRPVVIFTHSQRFAGVVVKRMRAAGYNAVEWAGYVSSTRRDTIKADFLASRVQYIVATVQSFSTGLDGFQAVCNRVVWLSETENPSENAQAAKRVFRSGDEAMLADFQSVKVVARDTYDQGILSRNVASLLAMRATLNLAA